MANDPTTILSRLEDERIFSIEKTDKEGVFCVGEECDRHFICMLTRDDLRQLAAEILEIANGE